MSLVFSIINIIHRENVTRIEGFLMKGKIKYILVAVVLSFMLCACGSVEVNSEEEIGSMQMINPIKQVTAEELEAEMQVSLVGVPKEAVDVTYTTIETGDAKIAQLKFTLDEASVFVRSQRTNATEVQDISGLYYEWSEILEAKVAACEAKVFVKEQVGYIAWTNLETGIVYNLGMTEGADAEFLIKLANDLFK